MGAENQHSTRLVAGRACTDGLHHGIKDLAPEALGRPVLAEQFVQVVLAEGVVGELEEGLAGLKRQPADGPACYRIERSEARAAMAGGAGLVEADVPSPTDAKDLEIDAAGTADGVLVGGTVLLGIFPADRAVRDVDVFRGDVDLVEKGLVHPAVVTVGIVGGEA